MALDLTLIPLRGPKELGLTLVVCSDSLAFDRDYEVFGQLRDLSNYRRHGLDNIPVRPTIKVIPIPSQMWIDIYWDGGIKKMREDGRGDELTFVYAEQLKKLKVPDDASPKNKAIKAFIDALPNDTPIILQWR